MNDLLQTAKPANPVLILVLGIVSLVIFQFIGPIPWYMGSKALKTMPQGTPRRGFVVAGRIMGIVATVLFVVSILGFLVLAILPGIG